MYFCFGLKEVAPELIELQQCHLKIVCMCISVCVCPFWDCAVAIFCQSGEGWQWPASFVLAIFLSTGGDFKRIFQTVQDFGLKVLLNIYASVFSFSCYML